MKFSLTTDHINSQKGIPMDCLHTVSRLPLPASHVIGWSALVFATPEGKRFVRLRKKGSVVWTTLTSKGEKAVTTALGGGR